MAKSLPVLVVVFEEKWLSDGEYGRMLVVSCWREDVFTGYDNDSNCHWISEEEDRSLFREVCFGLLLFLRMR